MYMFTHLTTSVSSCILVNCYLFFGDFRWYSRPVTTDCLVVVQLNADDTTLATFHFTELNDVIRAVQVWDGDVSTQSQVHDRTTRYLRHVRHCNDT